MNISYQLEVRNTTSAYIEYSEGITYADEDINQRYNLHIIVPVLWSLIIIFGIIGNEALNFV